MKTAGQRAADEARGAAYTTAYKAAFARATAGLTDSFRCGSCAKVVPLQTAGGTGYGYRMDDGAAGALVVCYGCSANEERAYVATHDRWMGYLVERMEGGHRRWYVTDWPGRAEYRAVSTWMGAHNWCAVKGVRFVNFVDHTGRAWTGRCVGGWTQVVHCHRLKQGTRTEREVLASAHRQGIFPARPAAAAAQAVA